MDHAPPRSAPPEAELPAPRAASELNNLLQIISGTTDLLGNIWHGSAGSERYLAMLRCSVDRATRVTAQLVAQLVEQADGADRAVLFEARVGAVAKKSEPEPAKPQLLIVDDEPLTLALFRQLLEDEGYAVTTAESGFLALDVLARGNAAIDLVLLDFSMPFMTGDETFRRIRSIAPDLPVILTTGRIQQEMLDELIAAGLAAFIRKPLPPGELLTQIARVLRSRRGATEASPAGGIAAAI